MTHRLPLRGCTPVPLAHYLKALGILRLIAEDKEHGDPEATGHWEGEYFVLGSTLFSGDEEKDRAQLSHFFLQDYQPTAILTPWNGRGGFLEGDEDDEDSENRDDEGGRIGAQMLTVFRSSVHPRFEPLKQIITAVSSNDVITELNRARTEWKRLSAEAKNKKKRGEDLTDEDNEAVKRAKKKSDDLKRNLLSLLRNSLSDNATQWFDACQVLWQDRSIAAPLLGQGGLDGSTDFGVNYLRRLNELFDTNTGTARLQSEDWLSQSLFARQVFGLISKSPADKKNVSPGQFLPFGTGGPNSGNVFEDEGKGKALVNPWDYVLMLEGALLFSAAATKRLESSGSASLSYPFTVEPRFVGASSTTYSDETPTKQGAKRNAAEMWLPLWDHPTTLGELSALLREGRVTVGRRAAKDGLDFARAVGALGVERGIAALRFPHAFR